MPLPFERDRTSTTCKLESAQYLESGRAIFCIVLKVTSRQGRRCGQCKGWQSPGSASAAESRLTPSTPRSFFEGAVPSRLLYRSPSEKRAERGRVCAFPKTGVRYFNLEPGGAVEIQGPRRGCTPHHELSDVLFP